MRNIRTLHLVLSSMLMTGFAGGCSARLADPEGADSSLIVGRVVIDNQYQDGEFPVGNNDKGIKLAIESVDGHQFTHIVTGDEGYFMIPNIAAKPYFLVPLFHLGDDSTGEDTGKITAIHEGFFAPSPGKVVDLGTFSIRVYENSSVVSNFVRPDPEVSKAYVLREHPKTSWLKKQFVGGSIRRVYSHRDKGYRFAGPPLKDWQRSQTKIPDIQFHHNAGGGWIGTGGFKLRPKFPFTKVNEWWMNAVSTARDWTNIKIIEEKDLTVAGLQAKLVVFEYTDKLGGRLIEHTYHIYKPGEDYDLFRIRLNCIKERYEWFLPAVEGLPESFNFF